MLCYVMLCYVMLCYVMLCYVMLCYVMLYMFRNVTLCYVMLKETNYTISGVICFYYCLDQRFMHAKYHTYDYTFFIRNKYIRNLMLKSGTN